MSETVTLTESKKKNLKLKIITYVVSVLLTCLILTPFVMMIKEVFGEETVLALEPGGSYSVHYIPRDHMMTLKEFIGLFNNSSWIGFRNSVIVTFTNTILNIYFSAITAYAITAYEWRLREAFEKFIIVAMMIPSTVGSVGFYQIAYKFGLNNKLFLFIIPAIATPMTVFFMRMYLKATFSRDIIESARLDGAGEFRIFNQIALPMLKPAVATQTIFCFVASWSNTWVPRILLIDDAKRTLPISSGFAPGDQLLMAIPPILIYAFCQKHIVEGIALGSVKN
ncbi:MAG: carbohydrate ABC transporter permease [Lachnospiraceae bacterium]|nr:carbohydrate ABC transporter permease [Lachnospiraceae bacterium]